jgi:hypothetical protein
MSDELPLIVFITSAKCAHCISFRGVDGRPNPSREWNYDYIRSLLNEYPSKTNPSLKRRAAAIVEIHISTMGNTYDNISEINIYTSIPSIAEINELVRQGKAASSKFFEMNDVVGNSIERVSIKRGVFDSVDIRTEIDGVFSRHMTDAAMSEYVWQFAPEEIQIIRTCVNEGITIPHEVLTSIPDPEMAMFAITQRHQYESNIKLFDQQLLTHHFNFPWVVSKILAKDIRRYESHYPCWMLVSPKEWRKSLEEPLRPIYARVKNHMTQQYGTGYKIVPFSDSENIEILLDKHANGTIKLEFDPVRNVTRKFSWQR